MIHDFPLRAFFALQCRPGQTIKEATFNDLLGYLLSEQAAK